MLANLSFVDKVVLFFKLIEPFIWVAQGLLLLSLLFPKYIFKSKITFIYKLLKYQGFDKDFTVPEKVYKIWVRDVWILFFLNPLIIIGIHLI
ncbi:MAG: hypothetical protein WCH62_07660 [Candidatus Omnitrophota bacterium]